MLERFIPNLGVSDPAILVSLNVNLLSLSVSAWDLGKDTWDLGKDLGWDLKGGWDLGVVDVNMAGDLGLYFSCIGNYY